jgi:alpha-glucuronidase
MAAAKFASGVLRDSGAALPIVQQPPPGQEGLVILGAVETNPEVARLVKAHRLDVGELGDEDFLLRTLVDNGRPCLLVAGGGPRGVLYGAQEAFRQAVTSTTDNHVYATACDVMRSPAMAVRGTYCLTCWAAVCRHAHHP